MSQRCDCPSIGEGRLTAQDKARPGWHHDTGCPLWRRPGWHSVPRGQPRGPEPDLVIFDDPPPEEDERIGQLRAGIADGLGVPRELTEGAGNHWRGLGWDGRPPGEEVIAPTTEVTFSGGPPRPLPDPVFFGTFTAPRDGAYEITLKADRRVLIDRWARFDHSQIPRPRLSVDGGWGDGDGVGVDLTIGDGHSDPIVSVGFSFRWPWLSQWLWDRAVRLYGRP
jgi:hypothetical protein